MSRGDIYDTLDKLELLAREIRKAAGDAGPFWTKEVWKEKKLPHDPADVVAVVYAIDEILSIFVEMDSEEELDGDTEAGFLFRLGELKERVVTVLSDAKSAAHASRGPQPDNGSPDEGLRKQRAQQLWEIFDQSAASSDTGWKRILDLNDDRRYSALAKLNVMSPGGIRNELVWAGVGE